MGTRGPAKLLVDAYPLPVIDEILDHLGNAKFFFIAPPLKIRFSVPVERVETTANQILERVAMKNSVHYSKQNTVTAIRVIAALASLAQQTSH